MPQFIVIANIHANPEHADLVRVELIKLLPVTRAEKGCVQYDLHQDNDNPAHFMLYETWETRTLWRTHMNAPHIADYVEATHGAVVEFTLNEMAKIK